MPDLPFLRGIADEERQIIPRQIERGVNTQMTSSCGRLFDAVAAMTGLCAVSTFEGQAAMALEAEAHAVECESMQPYPFRVDADGVIRLGQLLEPVMNYEREVAKSD
jgi:hydrogenase maturation protein HypF